MVKTIRDSDKTRAAKAAGAKAAATVRNKTQQKVTAARGAPKRQAAGFMDFIRTQGVVGLAVGLVLGAQIKVLVDQMLASFVNPLLGIVLPGEGDLSQKKLAVHILGKPAEFQWGAFVYVLISFLIIAAIIYYIVKGLKLDRLDKKDT